jgi:2',3'-cyclic-nucleotide 2'-phosphodiesterase (5'-nucleotidase family)
MKRHNVNKAPAIRAVLSLIMASSLFLSSNLGASVAHAEEKKVSYNYKSSVNGNISDFVKMADEGRDLSGKTVIISTNDVHGAIQKYPYVAALKKFFSTELKADVLLVDSGDFSQDKKPDGNPGADSAYCMEATGGRAGVEAMNAAGYDIATLGNHEFERFVTLDKNLEKAQFKVINSNLVAKDAYKKLEELGKSYKNAKNDKDSKKKFNEIMDAFDSLSENDYYCQPNYIYNSKSGINVGFFGLLTGEANLNDYKNKYKKLKSEKDLNVDFASACAKYQIESLRNNGADIVICLSHLGLEDDREGNRSIDVYDAVTNKEPYKALYPLDLILDGHSHNLISSGENGEPLISGEMLLREVGITIIGKDEQNKAKIEKSVLVTIDDIKESIGPDKATAEVVLNLIKKHNSSLIDNKQDPYINDLLDHTAEQSDNERRKSA